MRARRRNRCTGRFRTRGIKTRRCRAVAEAPQRLVAINAVACMNRATTRPPRTRPKSLSSPVAPKSPASPSFHAQYKSAKQCRLFPRNRYTYFRIKIISGTAEGIVRNSDSLAFSLPCSLAASVPRFLAPSLPALPHPPHSFPKTGCETVKLGTPLTSFESTPKREQPEASQKHRNCETVDRSATRPESVTWRQPLHSLTVQNSANLMDLTCKIATFPGNQKSREAPTIDRNDRCYELRTDH